MKTIIIKILLITAGLLIISCTPITHGYSYLLLDHVISQVGSSFVSSLYTIPTILCLAIWVLGLFGVPALGIGAIIYGIYYRGKNEN